MTENNKENIKDVMKNFTSQKKNIRILIVDDDEDILELLRRWLTDQGYTCQTASTGQQALNCIEAEKFCLMILDIKLPNMSGMDILDFVLSEHQDLPVIMATSMENRIYMNESFAISAYGFISKPFVLNEVISNVTNALRRRELELENLKYRQGLEDLVAERTSESEDHENIMKYALDKLQQLMNEVVLENNLDVRFENSNLKNCYEIQNCNKAEYPCYGKGPTRCWQTAGTFCNEETQGCFADKYVNCTTCAVYKEATPNPIFEIGESFNNMMNLLALKHHNLENSYEKLKASQEQLLKQEKMASIGQLSAGIAHEINNPVGFVSSNLGSLKKYIEKLSEFISLQTEALKAYENGDPPIDIKQKKKMLKINFILDDLEDLIHESREGCSRIKSIVSDLKSFSREDSDKPEACDINETLQKTLNVIWNELKYKTKVIKDFGKLQKTKCYPRQLGQIFMNLLINASHAIEDKGEITIKTNQSNGFIYVAISDTGCGIPRKNLKKIFKAFYTTKAEGVGTGLGLSICQGIIKKHNGTITVDSNAGEGTTFTVQLPVTEI